MRINVFSFFDDEGKGRYPKYIGEEGNYNDEVNLLYWNEHFALISQFSGFIADLHWSHRKKEFCKKCFGVFNRKSDYELHLPLCKPGEIPDPIFIFPTQGEVLTFKDFRRMDPIPFVIYADFECLLVNSKDDEFEKTAFYSHHIPCSVAFKIISRDPTLKQYKLEIYTGQNSVEWFLERLIEIEKEIIEILYDDKRMIFTENDYMLFQQSKRCYICKREFIDKDTKVRDHDHLTGKFRGAAHMKCNLFLRKTTKIPIFLHNFRGIM